jgi:hypothetical protein
VDEELVMFLKKKFPPTEYKQGVNIDTFTYDSIFRAGQRDIIALLETWYKQKGGKL